MFNAQEQGRFSECLHYSGFLPLFLSEDGFGEGAIFGNVWDNKKPKQNKWRVPTTLVKFIAVCHLKDTFKAAQQV